MYYLIRISPYTRMCAKSLQSCLTLCNTMDCSLSGSSVHGILQARILEWVAIPSSRGSFQSTVEPVSFMSPALAGGFFKPHPHTHTLIHADGILPCQKNRPVFILSHVVQFIMLCLHVSLFWSCSVPGTYFQIKNSAIAQFRAYLKVYDRGFYFFIFW